MKQERSPCIADLRALKHPVVAACLDEWERGTFCSLEQALILALKLVVEGQRTSDEGNR